MALSKIQFGAQDLEVVSIRDENEELWLLANPFAKVLEYSNTRNAVTKFVHKLNQKQIQEIKAPRFEALTSSVHPHSKFINRAGLFELIQASRMPKAQEFRDWVNSDLLVKLCDTGEYRMQIDASMKIAHSMNAVYAATSEGKAAPWMKDLSELKQIIVEKDQIIAVKDEENKKLTITLQEANQNLAAANKGLLQAFEIINEARKETVQLANRMADIAQDVIAKPSDPQLLHSLAVCAMGGDQYAFLRPQRRSLQRSLNRLSVDSRDIVFKSDYVPNAMNVLNKVKESLPRDKFKAKNNKITLLDGLDREDLMEAINSTMTERQVVILHKTAKSISNKS